MMISLSNKQLYGFAYAGPFGHFFHKLMAKIFEGKKGKETTAKKACMRLSCILAFSHESCIILSDICSSINWLVICTKMQVIVEQLTVSPWNNMMFMMYYGLVVEGIPLFLSSAICVHTHLTST